MSEFFAEQQRPTRVGAMAAPSGARKTRTGGLGGLVAGAPAPSALPAAPSNPQPPAETSAPEAPASSEAPSAEPDTQKLPKKPAEKPARTARAAEEAKPKEPASEAPASDEGVATRASAMAVRESNAALVVPEPARVVVPRANAQVLDVEGDEGEAEEEEPAQQVNIFIRPKAAKAAKAIRRSTGREHYEIAMDAVDWAVREQLLGMLIAARRTKPRPEGSVFGARKRARTRKAPHGGARIPFPVQFTPSDLQVLERLQKQYGAETRSELVSAALEGHLLDDEQVE